MKIAAIAASIPMRRYDNPWLVVLRFKVAEPVPSRRMGHDLTAFNLTDGLAADPDDLA